MRAIDNRQSAKRQLNIFAAFVVIALICLGFIAFNVHEVPQRTESTGQSSFMDTVARQESLVSIAVRRKIFDTLPRVGEHTLHTLDMFRISKRSAELEYWMRVFGYDALLDELVRDANDISAPGETQKKVLGQCHIEGHYLGRMASRVYGLSSASMSAVDTRCQMGFFHGVMESQLGIDAHDDSIKRFVAQCEQLIDDPVQRFFCEHLVGHGIMVRNSYDLPASITQCHTLFTNLHLQRMCYGGVFMENAFASLGIGLLDQPTQSTNPTLPDVPCTSHTLPQFPLVKDECYTNQSISWGHSAEHFDIDAAIRGCVRAPAHYRDVCFGGIGFNLTLLATSLSEQTIANMCATIPLSRDSVSCILGSFLMSSASMKGYEGFQNPVLCGSLGFSDSTACATYVKNKLEPLLAPSQ